MCLMRVSVVLAQIAVGECPVQLSKRQIDQHLTADIHRRMADVAAGPPVKLRRGMGIGLQMT